jgi:small-conductance mechanosensitive channel
MNDYEPLISLVNLSFLNNTVLEYLQAIGLLLLFLIIFKVVQSTLLVKLANLTKKTKTDIDDILITIIRGIQPLFYIFISLYFAMQTLAIHTIIENILSWVLIIWLTYIVIRALQQIIDYTFNKKINTETGNAIQALNVLKKIAKVSLWFFGILFLLSNMGINITSVFAGLGIGGIAVALALQNILSDLFSSFAIYFDKPFEVGDFIIVGDKVGVVEKIGIKTTRIRALQGEEIVISNNELTNAQIQNFKKLEDRRINFGFGVTYSTPNKKLEKIKSIVESIIKKIPLTRYDRCHFYRFDDSALFFETVYYVHSQEYNVYMDIQEQINLELKKLLEEEDIDMAFPTRTVHIVS